MHRADLGETDLLEPLDELVRRLPGHVGQHDVARRTYRRAAQDGQAAHGRVAVEGLQHAIGEVRRRRHAHVQHGLSLQVRSAVPVALGVRIASGFPTRP